ncbi:MAG TPA: hypothetical protein VM737_08180 [Gemmatimonadota bacterium]|nr:hypothetical protein [Gemmatimonadota bacterium]
MHKSDERGAAVTSPPSVLRALFGEERLLAGVGLLGLALAAACAAGALLRGTAIVPPDGDLTKPMSFDGAIGIWVLTIAALLPYADSRPRERRARVGPPTVTPVGAGLE